MDINITLLGRAAVDAPFIELDSRVVTLNGASVAYVPTVPPAAAGQELVLRVLSPDTVLVDAGRCLVPAPEGEEPTPDPFLRGRYVAFVNAPRDVAWWAGDMAVFARPGMAAV